MCQQFKRLLIGKTRRVYAKALRKADRVIVYAECMHELPVYYLYYFETGHSSVKWHRRNWEESDFMQWPEEVKDMIAAGGYKRPERPKKAKPPAKVVRAAKAREDLARWTKRLKLAQTKVRKLKVRVAYYDRTLARTR